MDPNFPDVVLRPGGGGGRRCRVVYSYEPQNEDELELVVDDDIEFIAEVEEGWWRGRIKGHEGVFPSNFVVEVTALNDEHSSEGDVSAPLSSPEEVPVLPPKPVKEQCRVLFAYDAAIEDELTLKKDDIVTIITKDVEDKGWWKGELRGKIGLFPDNFVQLIPTPDDMNASQQLKPERPAKNMNDLKGVVVDSKIPLISSTLASPKKSEIEQPVNNMLASTVTTSTSPVSNATTKMNEQNETVQKRLSGELGIIKPDTVASHRKSLEQKVASEVAGKKPPLRPPVSGKPKPAAAAKPTSVLRRSVEITDFIDGLSSSKMVVTRPKSSESESEELDLDSVGRADMLNHITASRPRAPGRRPPSVAIAKDIDVGSLLTNGNSEKPVEMEKGSKENKYEKHKPPFMDELKVNLKSAKPPAATAAAPGGVDKIERKTSPSLWGAKSNSHSTFESSSSTSTLNSQETNSTTAKTSIMSNVELRHHTSSTASVISSHRTESIGTKVSELSSVFGDKSKVVSQLPAAVSISGDAEEAPSRKEVLELRSRVEKLEKTVVDLVLRLQEESDKRRVLEKEISKLTDLVTQV